MEIKAISDKLSVSAQLNPSDIPSLADQGIRSIICNRPDGEGSDQPTFDEIKAVAEPLGLHVQYLPVTPGKISDENVTEFSEAMHALPKPALAFCRTGMRSATLWSLSQAHQLSMPEILSSAKGAGYDMSDAARRIANGGKTPTDKADASYTGRV